MGSDVVRELEQIMKRRNEITKFEIIRPEPITDEALSVLESIKRHMDDMEEHERIQERIDNLNVSPLQQRINKIRKIADDACDRIDKMEDRGPWFRRPIRPDFTANRLNSTRFQYKPIIHNGIPTVEAEPIPPKYDYQEKIYPAHPFKDGLYARGLIVIDEAAEMDWYALKEAAREMDKETHTPKDTDKEYDPLSKYRKRNK